MKFLVKKSRQAMGLFTELGIDDDFEGSSHANSLFFLAHLVGF